MIDNADAPHTVFLSPATPSRAHRKKSTRLQIALRLTAVVVCACCSAWLCCRAKLFAEQHPTLAFQLGVLWVGAVTWTPLALLSFVSTALYVRAAHENTPSVQPRKRVECALYAWGIAAGIAFKGAAAAVPPPLETCIMVIATCVLCAGACVSVLAYSCAVPVDFRVPHIV